jgi:hypothetical protein
MGVITSYYGWNGQGDSQAAKLLNALIALRYAGIDRNLLIEMNDSGFTFNKIAVYLDRHYELPNFQIIVNLIGYTKILDF